MRRITVKMAAAVVLVVAVGLIAGAASAQAFPPGLFPTQTSPAAGPTQAPPVAGPTQTSPVAGPTQTSPVLAPTQTAPVVGPTQTSPVVAPTLAQTGVTAITNGPGDREYPVISGNTVAWLENDTMSVGIYDVASGRTLPPPGNETYALVSMRQIDASGSIVVWTGVNATTATTDVYLYETASGTLGRITNDGAIQAWPSISDNIICWANLDLEAERGAIYWYNTGSGEGGPLLTNATFNQVYPAVGGDTIAWLDDGEVAGRFDLCWASIESGQSMRASSQNNITSPPAVSSDGSRIVWVAEDSGGYILNMLDVGTMNIKQITGEGALPITAAVDGNYVVWTDYRNGNGDIYLYDIRSGQERQVTSSNAEQMFPDVSGDKIVWMGNDDGAWNIYLGSAGAGPQPTGRPTSGPTYGPVYPTSGPTYGPVYPTGQPTNGPTYGSVYPTEEPTYEYPEEW